MTSEEVHRHLRETAKTLNAFCLIEILVVIFFCYLDYYTIMQILTYTEAGMENVSWIGAGIVAPITAGIFGLSKNINETFRGDK